MLFRSVASNVCAFGGQAVIAGVVGNDVAGQDLLGLMKAQGIDTRTVRTVVGLQTTVKMRVLADRQQVVRVDWESDPHLPPADIQAFCELIIRDMVSCEGGVVEDYIK